MNIYWDTETFSQCNLKDFGAHRYAADPSTGIHFMCFACDDGEVQVWRPGDPVRSRLPTLLNIGSLATTGNSSAQSTRTY